MTAAWSDQIVEFQGFDQIGIPDQRAVGDANIADALPDIGDLRQTFLEYGAIPEDGAVHLHDALHFQAQRRRRRAAVGMPEAIEARERQFAGVAGKIGLRAAWLDGFRALQARGAAKHHQVDQRVAAQSIGSVHGDAGGFAQGHEARHDVVGIATFKRQHLAVVVGGNAAHVVVHGWQDRDRLATQVDAGEDLGAFGDAGQPFVQDLGVQVIQMQEDVILFRPHAAAFPDLDGHGTRDHVAGGAGPSRAARNAP